MPVIRGAEGDSGSEAAVSKDEEASGSRASE